MKTKVNILAKYLPEIITCAFRLGLSLEVIEDNVDGMATIELEHDYPHNLFYLGQMTMTQYRITELQNEIKCN